MILVTGATGFLGGRVCKKLETCNREYSKTSLSLGTDLREWSQVEELFTRIKPKAVLNCAAYVGGIQFGYKHPAELFTNNLKMALNLLEACKVFKVRRIVNPLSNCAYPAKATLFKEGGFWDGPMHESVLSYGFARKAFWVGSWAYNKQFGLDAINLVLSNMYGPGDHFDEVRSHALGALIMKIVRAKENHEPFVTVWGTGKPVREWLHVDDGAEAMIRAIDIKPHIDIINVGIGKGISIAALANLIKERAGYTGELRFDSTKPDGAPYKTVDGSKGKRLLGWEPEIDLETGVTETLKWYVGNRGPIHLKTKQGSFGLRGG